VRGFIHRAGIGLALGMALAGAPTGHAGDFTLAQVLGAPFPSDLTAAPAGQRYAWVFNARGRRNVWLAERAPGGGFRARALTDYGADDGQEIHDLAFLPDGSGIVYVRGGDFEYPAKSAPNPTGEAKPPVATLWLVERNGAPARRLAEGHGPAVDPRGERVAYLTQGEIWSVSLHGAAPPRAWIQARGDCLSLRWSPDGKYLAFVSRRDDHSVIGLYAPESGTLKFVDGSFDADGAPAWSPDSTRLAYLRTPWVPDAIGIGPHRSGFPWAIRVLDVRSGRASEVFRAADGPGSVYHEITARQQLNWIAGGRLLFASEADGWSHLYAVPAAGGAVKRLTAGDFEVESLSVSGDGRTLVYAANDHDLDRRHLFRIQLPDGVPETLTSGQGIETHPALSADGSALAYLRGDAREPLRPAVKSQGVTTDLALQAEPSDFPTASLVVPEPVVLAAADGLAIHGQLFLPRQQAAGTRVPALVFLHGGPVRQMLLGWHYLRYYSQSYAFNQYLANRGYVVLSVNYRGGIGYGLAFREPDHLGAAGAAEFGDVLGANDYLRRRPDVDAGHIGVWGGSYGGYLTALALARASDRFAAGVDFHGVHDWYHLSLAYRGGRPFYPPDIPPEMLATAWNASPISAVGTWRSPVLLIHGDDDRTVAFSESVRLLAALRERGVNAEQLVLPDETHDFLLHRSWLAAYSATVEFFDRQFQTAVAGAAR
jgi:dipeptidyl aminopeptidase/acylaminoacyl peptidase